MQRRLLTPRHVCVVCLWALLLASGLRLHGEEPAPAAGSAFNAYAGAVEARLVRQHARPSSILASVSAADHQRLHRGEPVIEQVTEPLSPQAPNLDPPGGLLRHWRGTAFVPAARAADLEHLLRDYDAYPQRFAPQVHSAKVLALDNDHYQALIRVRQQHILTVVLDSTYDVAFTRLDSSRRYSISRSQSIREIDSAGSVHEHALNGQEQHGFLWRLNTYWSYEERDGGLYMQIESISLSRSIPAGLGWMLRPFVESIPRESLEFTLSCATNALRKPAN